ncbi:MAG: hypothetical protein NDI61_10495 [Bdellovibrionaceae bacterium]|nr:hypothetical protein [Pseudobdellovibrionaceae bacterium]
MMEAGHPRHPSFGLQWDFVPYRDFNFARRFERMGFSHWSLRLETHLKYGGPLAEFLEERSRHAPIRFFSDYLPVAPNADWEPIHQFGTVALLEQASPARLTCRGRLPEIPSPTTVVGAMLSQLPVAIEVNILAENASTFDLLQVLGEVSATVPAAALSDKRLRDRLLSPKCEPGAEPGDESGSSTQADLITEIWLDPLREDLSMDQITQSICHVLEVSRSAEPLDITFALPFQASEMERAAARAEQIRERVMAGTWSRRGMGG